jgi:hypothetical protein
LGRRLIKADDSPVIPTDIFINYLSILLIVLPFVVGPVVVSLFEDLRGIVRASRAI